MKERLKVLLMELHDLRPSQAERMIDIIAVYAEAFHTEDASKAQVFGRLRACSEEVRNPPPQERPER